MTANESLAVPHVSAGERVTLSALLSRWIALQPELDREVTGVEIDSRQLQPGNVFIALAGETSHGLDFLDDAIGAGIGAVLVDSGDQRLPQLDTEALLSAGVVTLEIARLGASAGEIASGFYDNPSRMMKLVGITGTDGKTSVCELLAQALNAGTDSCASIGTLGSSFASIRSDFGLTTPDAVSLQKMLAGFRDKGARYVSMEVSSHAICQSRISGVSYDVAVLTNLGRDHLDYHGSMEHYRAAKEMLFQTPELRAAVLNADDEFGQALLQRLEHLDCYSFGRALRESDQHVQVVNIARAADGLHFELHHAGVAHQVHSNLIGDFNVDNLAAVFTILLALGISPELAVQSIGRLKPVRGRMELATAANGAKVLVDYAHNPHALESALKSIRDHVDGRLILVFGCGGDRDRGKRPLMGAVAEQYADYCIVTDDNPRGEDGDLIAQQIVAGASQPEQIAIERDRAKAIEQAISMGQPDDWILIAGKGHEQYQQTGSTRRHFSDSSVVAECIARGASR